MNEEIEKDIIMQIEMESYMKFNDTIANMNDHLGEIFSYSDIRDVQERQLQFEKDLAYKQLTKEHQALLDIKEYIDEHVGKEIHSMMYVIDVTDISNIVDKALEVEE